MLRWIVVVVLALFAALAPWRTISDPDLPWHLETGRWMLAHHAIPDGDTFSFTFPGQPWRQPDPLAHLGMGWWWAHTGLVGSLWFTSVLTFAIVLALGLVATDRLRHRSAAVLGSVLLLTVAVAAHRFQLRPQTAMYLLLALLLWRFDRAAAQDPVRRPWEVLPLLVFWGNFHASYTIALAFCGAWAAGMVLEPVRRAPREAWTRALHLAPWGLACVAAAACQPYPYRQLVAMLSIFRDPAVRTTITEWAPPTMDLLVGPPLVLAAVTVAALVHDRHAVRAWEVCVLALATYLGLHSVRFVSLWAVVAGPLALRHLAGVSLRASIERMAVAVVLCVPFLVGPGMDIESPWLGDIRRPRVALDPGIFVEDAAHWLETHRPHGRWFNSFNVGGFLIWRLSPWWKDFIDGRTTNVFPNSFLAEVAAMTASNWQPTFARWRIDGAVTVQGPVAASIARHPDWAPVYFDDTVILSVRRAGPDGALAEQFGYRALDVSNPGALLRARTEDRPRFEAMCAEVDRAVREAPRSGYALLFRALRSAALGDEQGYARDLAAAVRLQPGVTDAWFRLGGLALARRDLHAARTAFQRFLGLAGEGVRPVLRNAAARAGLDPAVFDDLEPVDPRLDP